MFRAPSPAERLGEVLGYLLAAVALGPPAALARSERRKVRQSFLAWCDEHGGLRLDAGRGITRRAIALPTKFGALSARVELDAYARRARVEAAIAPLPSFVRATFVRDGGLRVESDALDATSLSALREHVVSGKLGELRALAVGVASEELVVVAIAMTTLEAWQAIGQGVVELAEWLAARWPASYRS